MKQLHVYIASSFDEAELCQNVQKTLNIAGHFVPDVWWNIKTKNDFANSSEESFYGAPIIQAIGARHWETIKQCDIIILVSNLTIPRSFTGANVEVGYALALGKPVISIGALKRSAMYAEIIKTHSLEGLMEVVSCIAQAQR